MAALDCFVGAISQKLDLTSRACFPVAGGFFQLVLVPNTIINGTWLLRLTLHTTLTTSGIAESGHQKFSNQNCVWDRRLLGRNVHRSQFPSSDYNGFTHPPIDG